MRSNNAFYKFYRMHYLAANLIVYSLASSAASIKPALYDGAQVWRSSLRSNNDTTTINQLTDSEDLSLWHLSPEEAIFLIHPERKLRVHRLLSAQGINHTVIIIDVQRRIDEQAITKPSWTKQALRRGHRLNWGKYPTVEVIYEYLRYLSTEYPSICKMEVIGHSVENRSIKMVKVSNQNPHNKGFMVVGGQHAREWVGITSALFIMNEIVTKFDDQPTFMQEKDWYFIPLLNPDGYHYTYTSDRLWRKNRRQGNSCVGVDLNRNYAKNFNISSITEFNECKHTYSGPYPFSEPETAALFKATLKIKDNLRAMLDLHAFGQLILFPWSSVAEKSPDFNLHNATADGMSQVMLNFKNRHYTYGHTYHLIYPATGSLIDWMYSQRVRHSYVIEGRDRGLYGFLMPPKYIQEIGQELFTAIKHVAHVIEPKLKRVRRPRKQILNFQWKYNS